MEKVAFASASKEFLNWISGLGIDPGKCSRVIIDIQAGQVVKIYANLYGQKTMFDFVPPELKEAQIKTVPLQDASELPVTE